MRELILLVIPVLQVDEDTQVVCSSDHAHASSSELRAQLVVSPRADALLGAVDVEGRNGRVVRGLFGEIRDRDSLAIAGHAVGAARGCRVWCLQGRVRVFDFPITLRLLAQIESILEEHTLKNSPSVEL